MTPTPFYDLVPKDFNANLEWRKRLIELGRSNRERAQELWIMAARDPLFYINSFVWTYSPSDHPDAPVRPFVTWDFQDDAILRMNDAIGKHDIVIKKSREMGASWMGLALFEWRWHFMEYQSFLLASRDESYVDMSGNEKCLFAKVDFILDHLPGWMRPKYKRSLLRLENEDTHSTINGESATGELGRGDRRTAMFWDEVAAWKRQDGFRAIASTSAVTKSRIINSTPQGTGDAYHTLASNAEHLLTMHWQQHPEKKKGMYTSTRDGKLRILDKEYQFPEGYKFIRDGKLRSPYYDEYCRRNPIPALIAQEQDMDFAGSGTQFFDGDLIKKLLASDVLKPFHQGELQFDAECKPGEFADLAWGKLKLWVPLDAHGRPPRDRAYSVGTDVGLGTGASNSIISIVDTLSGEKVGEFSDNHTRPEALAKYAVALCQWFNGAFLIWEANGPGSTFGAVVMESGYRNVFYRIDETKFPHKLSDVPGFFSTAKTKQVLLTNYHVALAHKTFTNHSREAIEECAEIVFLDDGSIGHCAEAGNLDSSGAGDNHADRVIADALANKGMKERPVEVVKVEEAPPLGTFAERRARRQRDEKQDSAMVFS